MRQHGAEMRDMAKGRISTKPDAARLKCLVPAERITHAIFVLRGHRVMVDADLAELYGVSTKVLLQAVRRNAERFPDDFCF